MEIHYGLIVTAVAILKARRDVRAFKQQRCERLAPPRIAAGGQRPERVTVIALPPSDQAMF